MSVLSIGTQENQSHNYRVITIDTGLDCHSYFEGDTEPWNYYLVEGIGVSKDQYLKGPRFVKEEDTISYLMRCWKNNSLVYQVPGYAGICEIRSLNKSLVFDLSGRPHNSISQKGIYIDGNRKVIRK